MQVRVVPNKGMVVHSKRKKERKGLAGWLAGCWVCVCVSGWLGGAVVCVECFWAGHSLNPPFLNQINCMKLYNCPPNIPYNFARESLVEGRWYVVLVFQWRINHLVLIDIDTTPSLPIYLW